MIEHDLENLNIEDNPDDVRSNHVDACQSENNEDIESIMEYQHKILRKYTLLGMIQYSDAPFFHDMVDQRDYKMISIFEVFAINRNEEDFLENLGLFAQLVLEIQSNGGAEGKEPPEDSNPNIVLLNEFRDRLSDEEYQWAKQAIVEEGKNWRLQSMIIAKNVMTVINVYNIMKDRDDFIHSLKKAHKVIAAAKKI